MYEYKLHAVTKVYDGDTITVIVDLGFGVSKKEKLRLARIDTPEVRGSEREEGLKVRDWLRKRLLDAKNDSKLIRIRTYKDRKGKYGRYIAELFIDDCNINDELLDLGLAKLYK